MSSSPFFHTIYRKISKTSKAYISETFDLNDIKSGGVVKMPFRITFQKFEPVAPNLHNIVFDDVLRN